MGRQKKNEGCVGCLLSLIVISIIVRIISSIISNIEQILTVILCGVFIILALLCIIMILEYVIRKYNEKRNGERELTQKFLAKFKIDKQKEETKSHAETILSTEIPITNTEKDKGKIGYSEKIEFTQKEENIPKEKEITKPTNPKPIYMSPYEIEKFARECNAYVERKEREEQQEKKKARTVEKNESTQIPYKYVLFSESINIDAIIEFRDNYAIDSIVCELRQYIHRAWEISNNLERTVNPEKFFEMMEEIEKLLKEIGKCSYRKFNPEKEREHYYSKKNKILVEFLSRSFSEEYENALKLETIQEKINRITTWFSTVYSYKAILTPNAEEIFERLDDIWRFELLPYILEPENAKEV